MNFETFCKIVDLYKICGNKNKLLMHNFGEPLLNKLLPKFIKYASRNSIECSFFTNGMKTSALPFDREYWKTLSDHGLREINFSAHKMTVEQFSSITSELVSIGRVYDYRNSYQGTWAGQVGPGTPPDSRKCVFEKQNAFVVLWDGRISSCCLDVEGLRSELYVDDLLLIKDYQFEYISLCDSCGDAMRDDELL